MYSLGILLFPFGTSLLFTSWKQYQEMPSFISYKEIIIQLMDKQKQSFLWFSCSVMASCLQPHGLQHASLPVLHHLPEPAQTCPLSQCCHPAVSPSVVPFSSYLQSFPASGSFLMRRLFASGGQSIGASPSTENK